LYANYAKRVVSRFTAGLKSLYCLYLDNAAPMFTGRLNGQAQLALADSGSRVLLMDAKYARLVGLSIVDGQQYRTQLHFVDGSTASTSGMTFGGQWQFGTDGAGKGHFLDFHNFENAPAPVILSEDFLFGTTNAFVEYDCFLVDEDAEDENAHFFAIDIDTDYHRNG
jgi:hypothetical protein